MQGGSAGWTGSLRTSHLHGGSDSDVEATCPGSPHSQGPGGPLWRKQVVRDSQGGWVFLERSFPHPVDDGCGPLGYPEGRAPSALAARRMSPQYSCWNSETKALQAKNSLYPKIPNFPSLRLRTRFPGPGPFLTKESRQAPFGDGPGRSSQPWLWERPQGGLEKENLLEGTPGRSKRESDEYTHVFAMLLFLRRRERLTV